MQNSRSLLSLLLVASLGASTATLLQSAEGTVTAYVDGGKATVIAFLPPGMRDSQDEGAIEARAQVGLAVEKSKRCLGADYASYQVVFADRIVIQLPGREERFELSQFAPLVGAVLIRPGSNASILFAGAGPGAMVPMLSAAASGYFGKRCISG